MCGYAVIGASIRISVDPVSSDGFNLITGTIWRASQTAAAETCCRCSLTVEHGFRKAEVMGSNPIIGSSSRKPSAGAFRRDPLLGDLTMQKLNDFGFMLSVVLVLAVLGCNSESSQSQSDATTAPSRNISTVDNELDVQIGQVKGRVHNVDIWSTPEGARMTVSDGKGEVLANRISSDELAAKYPQLHELYADLGPE